MTEIISEREHTARKRHHCYECECSIDPGERYTLQVQSDGGLQTYKAHVECGAAASEYRRFISLPYWEESDPLASSIDRGDHEWLLEKHPKFAERVGINAKVAA